MKHSSIKSDSSGQTIILAGFVIAVIILGMGTILYSTAISGTQQSLQVSESTFDYFNNVKAEYGVVLMVVSDKGEINPFNCSSTAELLQFEDKIKRIGESHGIILNFTWDNYTDFKKHASATILFADGNKLFNDTVTYNLVTGKILYDTIPPGRIIDLKADTYPGCDGRVGAAILTFTAVGDDDYEENTQAVYYDIRYSREQITNNSQFYDDDKTYDYIGYRASVNGTEETITVKLPEPGLWYFSVKAIDEYGNPSTDVSINEVDGFDISAVASNFSPVIEYVSINGTPIVSNINYTVDISSDLNITFNVTDYDNDTVDVYLMMKNLTSDWHVETNWTLVDTVNPRILTYPVENIMENLSFYINATDYQCNAGTIDPPNAPESYYLINLSDVDLKEWVIYAEGNVSDSYIDSKNEDNVFNSTDPYVIDVDGDKNTIKRGLIRFDLTGIPDEVTIVSATISLHTVQTTPDPGNPIALHKVNGNWDESNVTWNIIANMGWNPNGTSSSIPNGNQFTNWTVTSDVRSYYSNPNNNHGWLLKYVDESNPANNNAQFSSKDAPDASKHPILYVTFYHN